VTTPPQDTGACWNCLVTGAEKCMIVGKKAPGTDGWPVFAGELCQPCKEVAIEMSGKPGALVPPPWRPKP
jgi:hypothetical protein